ncbi:sensor histidine kinase [Microbacterium binotii]|uniref:sensor histidine kinase n=1 Tax=Microbacterium binotii TaxID=462710 RepID=UPI001F335521|nr:PAS domain-containing sensor histidine kinase [Microbacterium binotii]UIN30978.1 PAS domain-containing sensor histidine kinase [Microbacterium binotii]
MASDSTSAWRARLYLFVQTQSAIVATFVLLAVVAAILGVMPEQPLLAVLGYLLVAAATVMSLVLPFERWPFARQSAIAGADLVASICLALSMYNDVRAIAALAAFPAVWLATIGGRWGAAAGLVGVYTAILAPPLLTQVALTSANWASVLLFAIVIPVFVVVARILVETNRHFQSLLSDARERESASGKQIERLGAVLRSYAETADIGVVVLDENRRALITNRRSRAFAELAGLDPSTGICTHMYAADRVTPVVAADQAIQRAIRGEAVEGELLWIGPPGEQLALISTALRLKASDGSSLGTMIVAQDITDQLRRGREREDALATLSHELRAPLNAIIGYADLLLFEPLPTHSRAHVDVIARNADRLLALSNRFLDGLQSPPRLEMTDIPLRSLVTEVVDPRVLSELALRAVTVDIEPDAVVRSDRAALVSILGNLVSNAVKYSREGDEVRVVAGEGAETVWVTVANTGSHIDRSDLERVFDRFYRAAAARESAVSGTGIGLAVSRSIAAALGGSLTADDVAEGASFTLRLPSGIARTGRSAQTMEESA